MRVRRQVLKIIILFFSLFIFYHFIKYFIEVTGLNRQVEPGALRGYSHCKVNKTTVEAATDKYPCIFRPQPNKKGPIIVTFINLAWIPLVQNWVCSAKRVGIADNIFLVSFERMVCFHFPGTKCYEHPSVDIHGTSFGKADYGRFVIERTKIILHLLSCGQQVALVDADITFLKNPMRYLERDLINKDIIFQTDSIGVGFVDYFLPFFIDYVCGGFIYMKPSHATKQLWLSVLQYQVHFLWNDQAGLNVCLRHYTQSVIWDTLDSQYFPNGRLFFFYKESDINNVIIVHANHLQGKDKYLRMIGSHVWCYKEYAERLCQDTNTYHHRCGIHVPFPLLPMWCREFVDTCRELYNGTVSYN